jgi:uncharacterized protein Yka (UPF0111/DUF47 family)
MPSLASALVTPLDREDILRLAIACDDVLDRVERAHASARCVCGLDRLPTALEQAALLVEGAARLAEALTSLRSGKTSRAVAEVGRLEVEANEVHRIACATLLNDETLPDREIMCLRTIHDSLEAAMNACRDAAHLVEQVIVKAGP